ncbi:hypothetical protein QTO34_018974 [Cnephaeus nilssonii]|uniref:Uncharacterized protein n=1 Tax=Cnephaeus nilssonii TaxID=3371016 RepID=A0AA40HZV3_CNENI|nr:hypothetical protein QTO34_018974 [Eptesicus nilssonii]
MEGAALAVGGNKDRAAIVVGMAPGGRSRKGPLSFVCGEINSSPSLWISAWEVCELSSSSADSSDGGTPPAAASTG